VEPDRKGADRGEAWLDIPDPIERMTARPSTRAPPSLRSLTRSETRQRRLVALAVCVAWPALVLSTWGTRPHASNILYFLAEQTLLWMGLVVISALTALGRGPRGLGGPVAWMRLEAIGVPALFVFLGLFWLAPGSSAAFGDIGSVARLRSCIALGISVAVPMIVVASWSLRRSFPTGAGWRGAALGASFGLAAAGVLTLHCDSTSGGHIALAHGGPILLSTLAGAAIASKLARA